MEERYGIIGLGVSNLPLLKYLNKKQAKVTVFDDRDIKDIPKEAVDEVLRYDMTHFLGKDSLRNLKGFDIIFRSPSCMPTKKELEEERKRGAVVTTEVEMLFKLCPCMIIGITGSDRKNNDHIIDI